MQVTKCRSIGIQVNRPPPGQLPPVRSPLFLATPVKRPQLKCHMRSKAPKVKCPLPVKRLPIR